MRKPFDKVWYLSHNKPVEGMIYFIECYINNKKNPTEDTETGYYMLSNEMKTVYYIISEYNSKHSSPMDLKELSDVRSEDQIFDTRKELCESLMED